MSLRVCLALLALFVCLYPQIANAQARQIKGYAVQIAALSSQQSADELVKGLSARGINAYWIKGGSYAAGGAASTHRVRIGNFPTILSANTYAEKLIGTGLLDAYAIAAYEPPAISNAKDHSFAQKNQGRVFNSEAIDMVAAIGNRGWLLLSSRSIDLTLRQGRQGNSAFGRELAKLAAFVGSRGWVMNNNIAKILDASTPANVASLATTRNWTIADASRVSAAIAVNRPAAAPVAVNTPVAATVAVNTPAAAPVAVNTPAATAITENAPAPVVVPVSNSAPSPAAAGSSLLNAIAPEIGRGPLSPSTSTGVRTGGSKIYNTPARLQGSMEMRDGRMWLTLRNIDADRSFSGKARITLTDDKGQQDVSPMTILLGADKEESFPVDEARIKDGSWTLMVYDQNGAARLIRGASFPGPPKPDEVAGAPNSPKSANSPAPVINEQTPQGPPSYVTGVYDATWAQPPAQPQAQDVASQSGPAPVSAPASDTGYGQNAAAGYGQNAAATTSPPPGPGQVTVTPRQIAITPENVTLELEISAQGPINYIMVTLRAGDYQDVRQALMSQPQGRVPFLVPTEHARGGFLYEVKDEAQRVLASGSGDFRQIARGN